MNKGAVLPSDSLKRRLLESRRKSPVGMGCLPRRTDGRTDGRNARVKRIPGAVTHTQQLRTWPSLRGWLSSESLPQRPKCHWAEQPPEKLLGGGTDSPIGHHTPLHPWRGEKITESQSWNGCHGGARASVHPVQKRPRAMQGGGCFAPT